MIECQKCNHLNHGNRCERCGHRNVIEQDIDDVKKYMQAAERMKKEKFPDLVEDEQERK